MQIDKDLLNKAYYSIFKYQKKTGGKFQNRPNPRRGWPREPGKRQFVYAIVTAELQKTKTVIDAMKGILEYSKQLKITCDNGSEFISKEFKQLNQQINVQNIIWRS